MKRTRRILSYGCKNIRNLEEFGTIGLFFSFSFYDRQKEGPPPTFFFFFSVVPCFIFHSEKTKYRIFPRCPPRSPWPWTRSRGAAGAGGVDVRGAAGRAAVFARRQRGRLRLSAVKCGRREGEGRGGGAAPARPFASTRG